MKIRPMTMNDYDQVIAVWKAAGLTVDQVSDSKQVMGEILKINPQGSFVAEVNGKIVGGVWSAFNGTKLFKAVEKAAMGIEAPKMSLGVELTNLKVVPFYEKFGFAIETDALWLGKELK